MQITGMTCAACANRIEKGLNKMEGVEEATVNLALEKSVIKYDSEKLSNKDFEKKIQDLGYDVVKEKKEFTITGMTCAACANRIEKGLNKLDGVSVATVNFALENGTVEYDPSVVSPADIIQRVEKLGYGAVIKEDNMDSVDFRQKEIQKQKNNFIISVVLSFPLLWAMVSHFSFTSFIYMPDFLMNPWVQMAFATPCNF